MYTFHAALQTTRQANSGAADITAGHNGSSLMTLTITTQGPIYVLCVNQQQTTTATIAVGTATVTYKRNVCVSTTVIRIITCHIQVTLFNPWLN